ncbi:unnamed protein product [Oppiella nova]|uniref:Uncharacterized protein n=1 Tax=Oppiella nova TaxID=334625 RepID=A0A7R9QTF7_9ACAR|nr:unnamed protein product [Oppiella nova]CAG2173356.1 unnamed protein product [Oppiella nova]
MFSCRDEKDYKGLNQLECTRVTELMGAANKFSTPATKKEFILKIQSLEHLLKDYSYVNDNMVRNIVSYSKCLNGFNNICAEDQLALIKYGSYDLNSFRCLRFYDRLTECFVIPVTTDLTLEMNLSIFNHHNNLQYNTILKYYFDKFLSDCDYSDTIATELTGATTLFAAEVSIGN